MGAKGIVVGRIRYLGPIEVASTDWYPAEDDLLNEKPQDRWVVSCYFQIAEPLWLEESLGDAS